MKVYNPNAIGVTTGFGVPTGGTSGQVLQKVNATNYNTQWVDKKSTVYPIAESASGQTWVKLGVWLTSQDGKLLTIRISSHNGFNANPLQPQITDLVVSTSNGFSYQSGTTGDFFAAGSALINTALGTGNDGFAAPSVFRIVQISNTQYEVFGLFSSFAGGFYTVDLSNSDGWYADGSLSSAPGGNYISITPSATNLAGQILPSAQTTANLNNTWADVTGTSFTLGTPGVYEINYSLSVNGTAQWISSAVFTSADIYVPGSGLTYQSPSATVPLFLTSGVHVTVTATTTYKLRVKTYNNTSLSITQGEPGTSYNGGSNIRWKKIA